MEIDQEILSTVILPLPLIQEGQLSSIEIDYEILSTLIQEWQLSFSGERMCTILVNCLED